MMFMPDMTVLYRMSRALRRFPDNHRQSQWHTDGKLYGPDPVTIPLADNHQAPPCGTNLCAGGWIAFQNAPKGSKLVGAQVRYADGETETIPEFAQRIAGLSDDQANALFYYCPTADDVDGVIDHLEVNPDADLSELLGARRCVVEPA